MSKCKTGKRMLSKWAEQVQKAGQNDWSRIMFGKRAYDLHVTKCKKCSGIKALPDKEGKDARMDYESSTSSLG